MNEQSPRRTTEVEKARIIGSGALGAAVLTGLLSIDMMLLKQPDVPSAFAAAVVSGISAFVAALGLSTKK